MSSRSAFPIAFLVWGLAAPLTGAAQHLGLAEVKARARELQSHILGSRDCPPDASFQACISPYVHQLSVLIRDYTVRELNDTGGDTNQLVKDLRGVEDIYQRDLWEKLNPAVSAPDSPFVYAFSRPSPAGELIVTVNHFSTGALVDPPAAIVIQGFRREGAQFIYSAETGDSLFGTSTYDDLQMLPSPRETEMWMLISGRQARMNMGRLDRARIYSFDGFRFDELWAPEAREILRFHLSHNELHLTYLGPKIERRFGQPEQHVMEEKLMLSRNGVSRILLVDHGSIGEPPEPKF